MEHLKLILIFNQVLKYGSMNAAAPHLAMSASAISQHIKNLENHYKIKLLHRTTRKLTPTEAGRRLWQYAEKLALEVQETDEAMRNLQDLPEGDVCLTMPSGFVEYEPMQWCLQQIRRRYPQVRLHLLANDQAMNLSEQQVDIAIRVGEQPDNPDYVARFLTSWEQVICASPTYLAQHPIQRFADLRQVHWLNHSSAILQQVFSFLQLPSNLPENRTECGNELTAKVLAVADAGVMIALKEQYGELIHQRKLQIALPHVRLPEKNLYAITAHRSDTAKIEAVLGVLKEGIK